jgi:hypothetical protein
MQQNVLLRGFSVCQLPLALVACGASPEVMHYSQDTVAAEAAPRFELFTTDARLQESAVRARQRIADAIGEPALALAEPDAAELCQPFEPGCGFELRFDDVVYCAGDPDPALACTSQGVGGKTLGIAMQATLAEEELDNRLIHELFHVITWNRAPHSLDGLFMEYSLGDERISAGTLTSVCDHFACSRFVIEDELSAAARGILLSHH